MIVIVLALSIVNSSAIVHTITFDWEELGAKKVGTSATADDYFGVDGTGEKVHNLRCNYSQWDNAQEYLWVVSNWSKAPRQPAWIYLGKQDMSIIATL